MKTPAAASSRQAAASPPPTPAASPRRPRRRAHSSVALLAPSRPVFTQRMEGSAIAVQSGAVRRAAYATVKAVKSIVTAVRRNHSPTRTVAAGGAPSRRPPEPPPFPAGGPGAPGPAAVAAPFATSSGRDARRSRLRLEVLRHVGWAIVVGPALHGGQRLPPVQVRRWGGRLPLQRRGAPGVQLLLPDAVERAEDVVE